MSGIVDYLYKWLKLFSRGDVHPTSMKLDEMAKHDCSTDSATKLVVFALSGTIFFLMLVRETVRTSLDIRFILHSFSSESIEFEEKSHR